MKPILALLLALSSAPAFADDLPRRFETPPDTSRPWVYWFWNNGNVTDVGIKADLEAMQRVGVGGVIIMDVLERFAPPRGTAEFMNPEWRKHFSYAVSEAKRLGLEINMTNGPGWCGSSGPWITPELSMQMLVASTSMVEGPGAISTVLARPALPEKSHDVFDSQIQRDGYYGDIVVLAYPVSSTGHVSAKDVIDVTSKVDAKGKLTWQAPVGKWIIHRIGHTTTGSSTRPPVVGGNGLECDKLSRKAMDVHFAGMMAKLIADVGPENGKALTATHIDSWEVGGQNWTPLFRDEFKRRRGYDPLPYLPNVVADEKQNLPTIGDKGIAARFMWDFKETVAELLAENYSGRLAELAHQHGMRLTIEGYNLPIGDEATYTARADEPMSEFWYHAPWMGNETLLKGGQMASVAHIYGRPVVGAESFTSDDNEKWMQHPATIKSLGDFEFSQGINRFVVHRFAHQPYLDRAPGATMGPWGLHYERTQTWWEMSSAWHAYVARCQTMLREGKYVADLCYLRPELPEQTNFTAVPAAPDGFRYDECSAEALIARMSVKNGRLVLPDGMNYRALVLPPVSQMTPALARKVRQLVVDGATVYANGPHPVGSPSLADLPKGDREVERLTIDLWGDCDGNQVTEHKLGKGRLVWGESVQSLLGEPDFSSSVKLNWIHRHLADREIYFVANPAAANVEAECQFRVSGMQPETWDPVTGKVQPLVTYQASAGRVTVPLHFDASGSIFVVFAKSRVPNESVVSFSKDGKSVFEVAKPKVIQIVRATYGVPGDAARTRDVTAKLSQMVAKGTVDFMVGDLAQGDDPAYGIVKTLEVDFTIDGKAGHLSGQDTNAMSFVPLQSAPDRAADVQVGKDGRLNLLAWQPGSFELKASTGKTSHAEVTSVPAPVDLSGPWTVSFPPKLGAPSQITLESLISLSESSEPGVKYFSGTATYSKKFSWTSDTTGSRFVLDLGDVQVMAQVKLNGHDLGTLWKAPYRVDITDSLRAGDNEIEVRVANLWPNRMIGDAALPADQRFTWSSWEPFTKDTPLVKSGLVGPVKIITGKVVRPQ